MATAVLIVTFGGAQDVIDCLGALERLDRADGLGVFIVENAGPPAYDALCAELSLRSQARLVETGLGSNPSRRHRRRQRFEASGSDIVVTVAESPENLGYAGGVNSWLEELQSDKRWTGFWILNPDTAPEPGALKALIEACDSSQGGMAGSVILDYERRDRVTCRGLLWRPWLGSVRALGYGETQRTNPDPSSQIDAPSGTSIYITRACLGVIGFMSEEYFLYFEDLDWGLRAKKAGALRLADRSYVPHKHGASMGSANKRADRSRLSVYLDTRNLLLFTRRHDPALLLVAFLRSLMRAFEYLAVGSGRNFASAMSGIAAGLKGERGRPMRAWLEP